MTIESTSVRWALRLFAAVLVVHLGAQLAGAPILAELTQWLLMPLIATMVWLGGGSRRTRGTPLVRLTLLALGFSWLGDLLPNFVPGPGAFFVLVGMFALAQAGYAVAFWPYRHASLLRTPWVIGYGVAAAVLIAVCVPGAGFRWPAVVGYALIITVMAVLATGVDRLAGIGGVLFMISDSLLALNMFWPGWDLPGQGFWVMLTYAVGQLLIALGVLRASAPAAAPVAVAGPGRPA